jgi:hypothetical protein
MTESAARADLPTWLRLTLIVGGGAAVCAGAALLLVMAAALGFVALLGNYTLYRLLSLMSLERAAFPVQLTALASSAALPVLLLVAGGACLESLRSRKFKLAQWALLALIADLAALQLVLAARAS